MMYRFWADFTARDFAALERESLVAVLPIGATEQHGPHLPLSVDRAILDGIMRATSAPLSPTSIPPSAMSGFRRPGSSAGWRRT